MHPDQQQYDLNNKMAQWNDALARAAHDRVAERIAQDAAAANRSPDRAPAPGPAPRRVPAFFAWLTRRSIPPAAPSR